MPPFGFDHTIEIAAAPARVFAAFFDPAALADWWQCVRSVTTPRPLGVFAVEWNPTPFRDEVLGRLGGVLHGMVMDVRPGEAFFVANVHWIPPEGDPVGPMALEVTCAAVGTSTRLGVALRGYEAAARWQRYYQIVGPGLVESLLRLKRRLEQDQAD